jgi:hypothetical protein
MNVSEVFAFGRPGRRPYDPDPRHFHDRDRGRGWWGYDAGHRRHYWRWDNRRHCWY